MPSPLRDTTQPASTIASRQQAEHPFANGAAVARKAATAATQPSSLPEDVVTLSSSRKGSAPERKASQPVNSEEKRALLQPDSPRSSFSVYG